MRMLGDEILHQKTSQYTVYLAVFWIQTTLSTFVHISGAQVILPGRSPKIYLPAKCDGYALNGLKHGVIITQTDSGRYFPNTDCKVYFNVGPNQIVHFDFEDFSLQNRIRGRCVDFVQFFADNSLDNPLTEPLCGQSIPQQMSLNASTIVLYFHSNAKHETKGFKVRFQRSQIDSESNCSKYELEANRKKLTYFLRLPAIFLVFPALLVSVVLFKHFS